MVLKLSYFPNFNSIFFFELDKTFFCKVYTVFLSLTYLPSKDNLAAQSTSNRQGRGDVLEGEQAKEVLELLKNDAERTYDNLIIYSGCS